MVPLPLCLGCQVSEANSTEFQWTGSDLSEAANKLHSGLCFHVLEMLQRKIDRHRYRDMYVICLKHGNTSKKMQ